MKTVKFYTCVAILSLIGFSTPVAWACDCIAPSTPEERLKLANVVFTGKVLETKVATKPSWKKTYRFKVIQQFKGAVQTELVLTHGGTNCAFDFLEGESYLVYAYQREVLEADICSATQKLSEAASEVDAIKRIVAKQGDF